MTSYASGGLASFRIAPGSQLMEDAARSRMGRDEGGSFVTTQEGQPVSVPYRFKSTNARQHGTAIPARSNVTEVNRLLRHGENHNEGAITNAGPEFPKSGNVDA